MHSTHSGLRNTLQIVNQTSCTSNEADNPAIDHQSSAMTGFDGADRPGSSYVKKRQGTLSHHRGRQLVTSLLAALLVLTMTAWLGFLAWGFVCTARLLM
jgi:hypothetical protein